MTNVSVKQLDQVLTQLNEILAKLSVRVDSVEARLTALENAPAKKTTTRGTK